MRDIKTRTFPLFSSSALQLFSSSALQLFSSSALQLFSSSALQLFAFKRGHQQQGQHSFSKVAL